LRVPGFEADALAAGTLILADQIEPVPATQLGLGSFVIGSYKVRPQLSREFSTAENLGLVLQLYNLQRDEAVRKSSVLITYRLLKNQEQVWEATESSESIRQSGEQVTLNRQIPLGGFSPDSYALEVTAHDRVSVHSISRDAGFQIKP
jgi:hypothetical protein